MKKNYKNLAVLFGIIFLIFIVTSCGLADSGKTAGSQGSVMTTFEQTTTSIDLTKELNSLREKLVNPPIITSHLPYQEINSDNAKELIVLSGKSDSGTSISLKVNGVLIEKKYPVGSTGDFEITDGVEIIEGSNVVEVFAVNSKGDKSEPTKLTFLLNMQKNIAFSVYKDAENLVEISGELYSKELKPSVYIHGAAVPQVDVYLKVNGKVVGQAVSGETGAFFFENIQLLQGANALSVWYVSDDGHNNINVDKEITVFKDSISPNPSSLTGYIGSNGNHLSWQQSFDDSFISYKIVRVEDPAKNPKYPEDNVIATITDKGISTYTDTDVIPGTAYFYTLWTLDKAGNLVSSNVLALPSPKYTISLNRLPSLQGNVLARREWYYEYYEITNNGNVPVYIQPTLVWFLLDPESDINMALNPLWAVYIWDPNSETYYYTNEDIRESHVSDWIDQGTTKRTESISYSADGLTKTTTILDVYKIAEENSGKRIVTFDRTTTIIEENLVTGASKTTTAHEVSKGVAEPEKAGSLIGPLQPGEKIKIAVKISNVAADNGDKIVVHFNFAPADSLGYYFTDDMVSTGDIFVTSSGK